MSETRALKLRSGARCKRTVGNSMWCIAGVEQGGGPVNVLFGAPHALPLEQALRLARVHIHRDVSGAFMGALALPQASWRARSGWYLLLNLLRVPGMARLLETARMRK